MRADNSIHLTIAARQRHERTRAKVSRRCTSSIEPAPCSPSNRSPAPAPSLWKKQAGYTMSNRTSRTGPFGRTPWMMASSPGRRAF